MKQTNTIRKNPSRQTCEKTIQRILITEVLENGSNRHFRTAADFMKYFESLYPASDALTKQVQRAIKSMNMPKDDKGYFIVNKTSSQLEQDNEIRHLFALSDTEVNPMEGFETIFLSVAPHLRSHVIHVMETSDTFRGKFLTIVETSNGLLLYTQSKKQLLILLNSLTTKDSSPNV